MCARTLLALAHLTQQDEWRKAASDEPMRTVDIMEFMKKYYRKAYKPNTRESVRKQALQPFLQAALVENIRRATNDGSGGYVLTAEFLSLLRTYQTEKWDGALQSFLECHDSLVEKYQTKRESERLPVQVNGRGLRLSRGKHNALQKAILEEFASRFVPKAKCLYVGDTTKRDLVLDEDALQKFHITITQHDKMPDVILYSEEKNWLFFIEAVTSVGPMSPKRILELREMTRATERGIVYVTAFPDRATYKKFVADLAWETEVWLAEEPEHMIHLNGSRFIGPYR